jgi:hypothetical protein
MVQGSCHCGAVTVEIPRAPDVLTSCNCSICRRLGTLWTYFDPKDVRITGRTETYCWGDKTLHLHHCPTCACITHWTPIEGQADLNRMGINARLLAPEVFGAARVRRLDGADTWRWLDD